MLYYPRVSYMCGSHIRLVDCENVMWVLSPDGSLINCCTLHQNLTMIETIYRYVFGY